MKKIVILVSFFITGFFLFPIDNQYQLSDYLTDKIKVEIKGCVENPGIYYLDSYSTINDLFQKAVFWVAYIVLSQIKLVLYVLKH